MVFLLRLQDINWPLCVCVRERKCSQDTRACVSMHLPLTADGHRHTHTLTTHSHTFTHTLCP